MKGERKGKREESVYKKLMIGTRSMTRSVTSILLLVPSVTKKVVFRILDRSLCLFIDSLMLRRNIYDRISQKSHDVLGKRPGHFVYDSYTR